MQDGGHRAADGGLAVAEFTGEQARLADHGQRHGQVTSRSPGNSACRPNAPAPPPTGPSAPRSPVKSGSQPDVGAHHRRGAVLRTDVLDDLQASAAGAVLPDFLATQLPGTLRELEEAVTHAEQSLSLMKAESHFCPATADARAARKLSTLPVGSVLTHPRQWGV